MNLLGSTIKECCMQFMMWLPRVLFIFIAVLSNTCYCSIYRLDKCRKYGATFSVIHRNKVLGDTYTIEEMIVVNIQQCVGHCIQNHDCKSFCYNAGKSTCLLKDKDLSDFPSTGAELVLKSAPGWVYMQADTTKPQHVHACFSNPCVYGECFETCDEPGYRCECDAGMIGENCDVQRCEMKYTSWNDNSGGNYIYLDRHKVSCETGKAIDYFQLEVHSDGGKFRYKYNCCTMIEQCQDVQRSTPFENDGRGNTVFLEPQNVTCFGGYLKGFRLKRDSSLTKIRYDYTCCELPAKRRMHCAKHQTLYSDDRDGHADQLSNHAVDCKGYSGISQFQLVRNEAGDEYQYQYTCC